MKGKKKGKKKVDDAVQEMGGPGEKGVDGSSPDNNSDEKLSKQKGKNAKKGKGKVSDPVTKGKISDDKESRSSVSNSDKEIDNGKVIK